MKGTGGMDNLRMSSGGGRSDRDRGGRDRGRDNSRDRRDRRDSRDRGGRDRRDGSRERR